MAACVGSHLLLLCASTNPLRHSQFGYSIITELPAIFLLYDSERWTGAFLMLIFAVSVWNGGGFYIEVFGRKYVLDDNNDDGCATDK